MYIHIATYIMHSLALHFSYSHLSRWPGAHRLSGRQVRERQVGPHQVVERKLLLLDVLPAILTQGHSANDTPCERLPAQRKVKKHSQDAHLQARAGDAHDIGNVEDLSPADALEPRLDLDLQAGRQQPARDTCA